MFEGLELVDEASSNGTDTLHTWLLVPLHPGGQWARRNLAGMPCRQGPSTLCVNHICLRVSLLTTPVLPPGECTSLSHRSVFSCTGRHRRTDTWQTDGLLSPLLPAPQEAPLFGGIGRYAAPMRETGARRQGQRHFFRHGSDCLYGQGLTPCRSRLPSAGSVSTATSLPAAPGSSAGKYLPGPDFLLLFCSVDGSMDG